MLSEDIRTPILMIALDDLTDSSVKTNEQLSIENSKVSESEIFKTFHAYSQELESDINYLTRRIPIPINDRILPIHYTGGTTNQSHDVTYFKSNSVLTKASNVVSLQFEILNDLSLLSVVSNLLLGVATKSFFSSNNPRVSFFSSNLTIFNAYLRGINRSVLDSTNKEIISITLEIAQSNKLKTSVKLAKKIVNTDLVNTKLI